MAESVVTGRFPESQSPLVRRLVYGGAWVFVGRIAGIGLAFLANVVLARWLPPGEFGRYLTIVSIIAFLSIVARFGLDRILVRFVSEGIASGNAMLAKGALRISFSVGLASTLLVAVLTIVILAYFRDALELSGSLLLLLGSAIPLFTLLYLVAESFRGFHQLRYASLFQSHSGPLTTLCFLCILCVLVFGVVVQPSLFLALACYVIPAACILPLAFTILSRTINRSLPAEEHATLVTSKPLPLSGTLAVCAPVAISDMLRFLAVNAGLWIAAACCSSDDLALFGAARQMVRLGALPLNLISLTVISSIPELHSQGRLAELQRMLQLTATVAVVPTVLITLVFVLLPALVLHTVFGSFYRDAAPILIILSLPWLVSAWTGSCIDTLLLTGRQNIALAMNALLVVALLMLGPICARAYGTTGIAVLSASIFAMINLLAWAITKAEVGVWTNATLRSSE